MSSDWMRPYLMFDPDAFKWASEVVMLARIDNGEKLIERHEMTREFFENLVFLMNVQKNSEYVGADGYKEFPRLSVPFDPAEMSDIADIVSDEDMHGNRIRELLIGLGFDANRWIIDHYIGYSRRIGEGAKLYDLMSQHRRFPSLRILPDDVRVSIFHYPIVVSDFLTSWINFTLFQFLQDRGAGEQLRDTLDCSFGPWCRENAKTSREENRHIRHGDKWMHRLYNDPENAIVDKTLHRGLDYIQELMQTQLNLWLPRVLATFGKPNSANNDLWRRLRLKTRTNEQTLIDYLERKSHPVGLQAAAKEVGIKIPSTEEILQTWRDGAYLKSI